MADRFRNTITDNTEDKPLRNLSTSGDAIEALAASLGKDKKGRSTWTKETLTDENFERCYMDGHERLADQPDRLVKLESMGRERALFYLLAVSTGLRCGELASITIGHVHLNAVPTPFLELNPEDAKSGLGASIPLRDDVVEELKRHIGDRERAGFDDKLFDKPPTIRVFDADIKAAGIAKKDKRGRVIDIHALRHTFGTHLSASGVHPRTAMAAMRHSRMELTMNYYTDPTLLDVAGAVRALPAFESGTTLSSQLAEPV